MDFARPSCYKLYKSPKKRILVLFCLYFSTILQANCQDITFHILTTESLVVGLITRCNLSGRSLISFFLSEPIRLVNSCMPLPLPSAFLFSHTLKVTPHSWMQSRRSERCLLDLSFGALFKFSFLSHSSATSTKLLVNMSTNFEKLSKMPWTHIAIKYGSL